MSEGDCVRWAGAHNAAGRPVTTDEFGMTATAYVVAWEDEFGMRVPAGLELHHICEHPWCVNPFHLYPATRLEHGRLHAKKLTIEDARLIRQLARPHGTLGQKRLAKLFGVSRTMIRMILRGERWLDKEE